METVDTVVRIPGCLLFLALCTGDASHQGLKYLNPAANWLMSDAIVSRTQTL